MNQGLAVEPLGLRGAALLRGVRYPDPRGHLRKVVVVEHARAHGCEVVVDEVVTTHNHQAGTVRGLHFQVAPHEETKTLWVTSGALLDVLVDVRPGEPTYGTWVSVRLAADDDVALFVPPGVAHGYQTLEDDTEITYLIGGRHSPEHARTLRHDDEVLGIVWPLPVSVISDRDREGQSWPVS